MSISEQYVIGFGTNNKFISKLVRFTTNGWCSHVWLEYSSIRFGGLWVIHATKNGVIRERIVDVWQRYPIMERYNVNWDLSDGIKLAIDYIGTPYDFGSTIPNALLLLINRYSSYRSTNIIRNSNLFNCSEFVTFILKSSKIPGYEMLDPEATTPIHLYRICKYGINVINKM